MGRLHAHPAAPMAAVALPRGPRLDGAGRFRSLATPLQLSERPLLRRPTLCLCSLPGTPTVHPMTRPRHIRDRIRGWRSRYSRPSCSRRAATQSRWDARRCRNCNAPSGGRSTSRATTLRAKSSTRRPSTHSTLRRERCESQSRRLPQSAHRSPPRRARGVVTLRAGARRSTARRTFAAPSTCSASKCRAAPPCSSGAS